MKSGDNRITIELPKGLKLVAEQNIDPEYQNEIYVGIETPDGIWHQDLAVWWLKMWTVGTGSHPHITT